MSSWRLLKPGVWVQEAKATGSDSEDADTFVDALDDLDELDAISLVEST
jgi:hypothetical protein